MRFWRGLTDLVRGLVLIVGPRIVLRPPRRRARWCPVGGEWTDPMTEQEFAEHVLLSQRWRAVYGPVVPDPDTGRKLDLSDSRAVRS